MTESMSVRDKIETGYYKPKMEWPEMPTIRLIDSIKERERIREEHKKQKSLYRQEEFKCNNAFKADLEKEHGFENHPKKDKLYELAWAEGHSGGYSEIANVYEEWADLLK